eukprot:gene15159-biopygen16980
MGDQSTRIKRWGGRIISLRPITLPVLCPRFGRGRVFRMRTFTHGLIRIGTLQRRL